MWHYSLEVEIAGVLREADAHARVRRGQTGTAREPGAARARWAGNWDLSPAEKALWVEYDRLAVSSALSTSRSALLRR
ncbi:MAG: hypothetical protein ACRDNE_10315 [Gaiellaceae bacterium]